MRSNMHNVLQDFLIRHYRALGLIAMKEYCINGKKIDVLSQDVLNKRLIANEIELSPKHAIHNIRKDLQGSIGIMNLNVELSIKEHYW